MMNHVQMMRNGEVTGEDCTFEDMFNWHGASLHIMDPNTVEDRPKYGFVV